MAACFPTHDDDVVLLALEGSAPLGPEQYAELGRAAMGRRLRRLVAYRILRHDPRAGTSTTHPLIRNYYFAQFTQGAAERTRATHARIQAVYLELAGDTPHHPTLDDLRPLIRGGAPRLPRRGV